MITNDEIVRLKEEITRDHGVELASIACLIGSLAIVHKSGAISKDAYDAHMSAVWIMLNPWMKTKGVKMDEVKAACEHVTRINQTIAFMNSIPE